MNRIAFVPVLVARVDGVIASTFPISGHADEEEAPIFGAMIRPGYRDLKLISVEHKAGNPNDLRAILGNDGAMNAYREGELPFPDGRIIAPHKAEETAPRRTP